MEQFIFHNSQSKQTTLLHKVFKLARQFRVLKMGLPSLSLEQLLQSLPVFCQQECGGQAPLLFKKKKKSHLEVAHIAPALSLAETYLHGHTQLQGRLRDVVYNQATFCLAKIHGILFLKGRKGKVHWGTINSLCHNIFRKLLGSSHY